MKRFFTNVCIVLILIGLFNCFLNFTVYADEEKYYDVQIPIFYGTTENFTTELLSGFTTSEKQKEGVIFVSLEDFQKLTDVEIKEGISNSIILKRNTVYLDISVNSGYTTLLLGLNENNLKQCIYLEIPIKEQNDTIYISLLHGLNAFGIEANILNEEDIISMISINEKILGKDFTTESLSYLENSNIFDFNTYPCYLQISMAEPFDKFFLEFINNRSDYLFSWDSLFLLNNTTSSLGSLPSYFISNQDGITDYLIGQYEPDERYYNVLFNIISNGIPDKNTLDISQVYEPLNFMNDTGIIDMIIEGTEVQNFDFAISYTISSVANVMEASERTINLFRCSEFEKNVLNKTLLSSDKLKVEMMDDKIITDLVRKSLFNKYIYNNYLSSFYNNQYALYKSAYRLNNDIKNPIENISAELYSTLIYSSLTSLGDFAFNEITYGFTGIADTLMQNIKHNSLIKDYILDPSETIGEIKDCYFIQDTTKNLCSLSIFDEFENSYYNFRLILQSSLTAYELLSKNEELLRIIGEDGKNTVTSKLNNINSFLEDILKCDTDFYMTENIWSESEIVKNISIVIVPVDFAKEVENYSWHLEPSIEAEDIKVIDNKYHPLKYGYISPYDECSIIKQNGKYGIIKYDGSNIADPTYDSGGYNVLGNIGVSKEYDESKGLQCIDVFADNGKLNIQKNQQHGFGYEGSYYYWDNNNKQIYSFDGSPIYGENSNSLSYNVVVQSADIDKNGKASNISNKYGIANKNKLLVPVKYDKGYMHTFNNIIALESNGKWSYFDKDGNTIISNCEGFKSNCNVIDLWEGYYGWMYNDEKNNKEYPLPYLPTEDFIPVKINGECGYYDTKGKEVIPCGTFEEVRPVHNGLAWVKKDGKWGVIRLNISSATEKDVDNVSTYTATQLVNTTIPEIIDIMGGKYDLAYEFDYYTSGATYFYNDEILPGLAFYITGEQFSMPYHTGSNNKFEKQEEQKIKSNLQNGKYQLELIRVKSPGKLDNKLTISNGMDYMDVSNIYGEFDCGFGPNIGYLSYKISNNSIIYLELPSEILKNYNDGKYNNNINGTPITAKEASIYNPKVKFAIVTPEYKSLNNTYEKIYKDYIESEKWRTYTYHTASGTDSTVTNNELILSNKDIFDFDGDGIPELLLYARNPKRYSPRGVETKSYLYTIVNGKPKIILSGYTCGGTLGGNTVCFAYDNLTSKYVVGLSSYTGGFGGDGHSYEWYKYDKGELTQIAQYGKVEYYNDSDSEYEVNNSATNSKQFELMEKRFEMVTYEDLVKLFKE